MRAAWRRRIAVLGPAIVVLAIAASAVAIGLNDERELGARFALEARRRLPLIREPALSAYLARVGERIAARLDSRQFAYRFFVVRDGSLNAFAVPGGYVYTHAGLLTQVQREAELAGVLAHEIVHVHAHHVVRQQEETALINYATLAGLFLSALHPALGAGAVAAGAAAQLKYQRQFEQEADHVGLDLMRTAGFDPAGMPEFLRRVQGVQQLNPAQVPPYFLSHPLTQDRVAELERARAHDDASGAARRRRGGAGRGAGDAARSGRVARRRPHRVSGASGARARERRRAAPARARVSPWRAARPRRTAARTRRRRRCAARPRRPRPRARAARKAGGAALPSRRICAPIPTTRRSSSSSARLRVAAGELPAATALLERALALDPELDDAEYALAECRGKSGDTRGQWWHLGRAFELRGEFERAMSAYEKARELSAEDTPERKDVEKAIAMLEHVLKTSARAGAHVRGAPRLGCRRPPDVVLALRGSAATASPVRAPSPGI